MECSHSLADCMCVYVQAYFGDCAVVWLPLKSRLGSEALLFNEGQTFSFSKSLSA